MKRIAIAFVLVLGVFFASAAKTNVTVDFTVTPAMTCQNCENKIKTNLRFEKGVESIVTDIKTQTVKVTFDSEKTKEANIIAALKKLGYTATVSEGKKECQKTTSGCSGCPHHRR